MESHMNAHTSAAKSQLARKPRESNLSIRPETVSDATGNSDSEHEDGATSGEVLTPPEGKLIQWRDRKFTA
jgi:hypothetical protein